MEYQPGQLIAGRYRIIRLLAADGLFTSYLAKDSHLSRQYVIEILYIQGVDGPDESERFAREVRFLAMLSHPNIVPILDYGEESGIPYIVIPYLGEGSLAQRHPPGTTVRLSTVVSYVEQVASALGYLHSKRILHRDVKPSNMLLTSDGRVLLADFGIAISIADKTESIAGTPAFMAPELFEGKPSPASDQYALGVVVYQWLSGRLPFTGTQHEIAFKQVNESPPSLHANNLAISRRIDRVVMTALAKRPENRFSSVLEFADALAKVSGKDMQGSSGATRQESYSGGDASASQLAPAQRSGEQPAPPIQNVQPKSFEIGPSTGASIPAIQFSPPSPQTTQTTHANSQQWGASPDAPPPGQASRKSAEMQDVKKTTLSLIALARVHLEQNETAWMGKTYFVDAGISQRELAGFTGGRFDIAVQDPVAPVLFDIIVHAGEHIQLTEGWYRRLIYNPSNIEAQLLQFPFVAAGSGREELIVNFYRDRQWLKMIRLQFDIVEQFARSKRINRR